MKSFTGDFIWSTVEHGRAEEKFYEKEYYLKEHVDNVIANLQKEVLQILSAFNSLFSQTRAKHAQLRKEKRTAKHAIPCKALPNHDEWHLQAGKFGVFLYAQIKYCPMCGRKLED